MKVLGSHLETSIQKETGSKAPLFWPLLFWCVGLYFGRNLPANSIWILALGGLCALGAIISPKLRLWLILLAIMLAGCLRISLRSPEDVIMESTIQERGKIIQEAEFEISKVFSNNSYEITLHRLAGSKFQQKMLFYSEDEFPAGACYKAILKVQALQSDPILDIYPSRYKHRASIQYGLSRLKKDSYSSFIGDVRSYLNHRIDVQAQESAPIAKALLLSDQTAKGQYRDILNRGGMLHLIVVSGLHIWFLYSVLILVFRSFLPRKAAELFFLIVGFGFAALNYWSAPVTRAMLMILMGILSRWMGRKLSPLQVLSFCLWIITLVSPEQLFDVGLQLSFLSVGILSLALPHLALFGTKKSRQSLMHKALNKGSNYLLLNVMVSTAILPLTLHHFGTGSLNGVVGNLLGVPLMAVLLPLSILMLFGSASSFITKAFISCYQFVVWIFEHWMLGVAKLPFNVEDFWLDILPALGLVSVLLPFYIWIKSQKRPNWSLYIPMWVLGIVLILLPPIFGFGQTGIWIFNCGTADCALIITPDKHKILVDTGQSSNVWQAAKDPSSLLETQVWAARKLIPWLKRRGIKRIDDLILTHTDSDHSGGVAALVTSMDIGRMIITDETQSSELWQLWQSQGWFKDSQLLLVTDTLSVLYSDSRLKFLHPDKDYYGSSENNRSIVFRLDVKDKSFLFTGDIEAKDERWLLSRYPQEIDTDYLKVPHHGSKSSSTDAFIQQVSPDEVWISVGEPNRYGFPHANTMQTLQKYSSSIKKTSDGTIYMGF